MKTLIIEYGTYGKSETPCIYLIDTQHNTSKFTFIHDSTENVVRDEANAYRESGYKIFNKTEIKL